MKRRWQLWVGLAISAAALALALAGIDLGRVARTLSQAAYGYLFPAGLMLLAYLVARAVRWRLLLGSDVSLARCFWITNLGYLVSNVLPFRLGDPARAVVVGRDGSVSVPAALSTVLVERVLDMLMVVLVLAISLPFVEVAQWARLAGAAGGAMALAALVVLMALARRPDAGRQSLRWFLARVPRLREDRWAGAFDGLLAGLSSLRSARTAAGILAWSIAAWWFVVAYYWSVLWAFLERPSLVMGGFLSAAIGFSMALPSAPGAVGVFHRVAMFALQEPFAVPAHHALSIAFASHAFQYLVMCLLGLVGLARESLSLRWVRTHARKTKEVA